MDFVTSLDQVPEALRRFYKKEEGGWRLQADLVPAEDGGEGGGGKPPKGFVAKERADEFRTNNIALRKELEKAQAEMQQLSERVKVIPEDFDPEQFRKYRENAKKIEADNERKMIEEGDIDGVLKSRTRTMRTDYETQLKAREERIKELEANKDTLTRELGVLRIEDAAVSAVLERGARLKPKADQHVKRGARELFQIDPATGQTISRRGDGSKNFSKDGENELTIDEWAEELIQDQTFLFEQGRGGGAPGADSGGAPGADKVNAFGVWSKDDIDAIADGEKTAEMPDG